jgi:hypothetical protein
VAIKPIFHTGIRVLFTANFQAGTNLEILAIKENFSLLVGVLSGLPLFFYIQETPDDAVHWQSGDEWAPLNREATLNGRNNVQPGEEVI